MQQPPASLSPVHSRIQEHPDRQSVAKRSTLVSVVVNLALTLVQVIAGVLAHSQGLIADGIHSLSDLIADFVVLFANKHSSKEADQDHHYGHRRFETAASLVLGGLLLAVGVGMLGSAAGKLSTPAALAPVSATALWVALGALVIKECLFRYMLAQAERVRSSMLVANAWHARSDAASSLVVAVGIMGNLLGASILDPVAALIVGFMVSKMGWEFGSEAFHDLTDRAISPSEFAAIFSTLAQTPGVLGVHKVRARKMGDLILVDAHLDIPGSLSVWEGHAISDLAANRVRSAYPVLDVMLHLDPK